MLALGVLQLFQYGASDTKKEAIETMSKKILLVDNNREYRHTVASIVRRVGYDVIHAEEIVEGLERLVSDRPDLVMSTLVKHLVSFRFSSSAR